MAKKIKIKQIEDGLVKVDGSNIPPTTHWPNLHAGGLDGYVFHGSDVGSTFESVLVISQGAIFRTSKFGLQTWVGIGTMNDLTTTHKTTIVGAINEVNQKQSDVKIGGRNLAINSTSLDALPLYGVTGDYEVVNDASLPSKKFFRLTNITRVAGDYVFYIPFGNLPLNYSYNLANVPLTISFFIRTNNTQYLTGGGIFTNVNNVFKKVEFQYMWGGLGNNHFFLTGAGLSFMEIHSLKIEIGTKATDWTPSIEEQIPDFNQTDDTQFNYIKNKPNFADFVSKLNINEDVDGIKRFIGAYVGWLLNGDQNNAWGYLESTNAAFNIGVQLSTKPIDFYNNGIRTARMSQAGLEVFNNIYTTNYGSADLWKIAYDRGDFRTYGLGNTVGVALPNLNADTLLTNGFYTAGSSWVGSPYAGVSGLNQGYIEHQSWGNNNYCLQKFVNVNSEIHNLFRIKDNGVWGNWIRLADRDFVNSSIANIPIHNGQLTVNTTADLVGGYTYLPSGNVTTTLGLATHILNAIADGVTAYSWGNHANAGYTTLGTVQNWVMQQGYLTASALNGYVLQSSLTAQLANYATLAGTQTFTGQITFNQPPIVPNGTLAGHTVNLGQMQSYVTSQGYQNASQVTAIVNNAVSAIPAPGNGSVVIQGINALTGTATFSMNQSNNVVGSFDLTTATKNEIAAGANAVNQLNNLFGDCQVYFAHHDVSAGGFFDTNEAFYNLFDPYGATPTVVVSNHHVHGARLILHSYAGVGFVTYKGEFMKEGVHHNTVYPENGKKWEFTWNEDSQVWVYVLPD